MGLFVLEVVKYVRRMKRERCLDFEMVGSVKMQMFWWGLKTEQPQGRCHNATMLLHKELRSLKANDLCNCDGFYDLIVSVSVSVWKLKGVLQLSNCPKII